MTALSTASRHAMSEWARVASAELDEIVGRIVRSDAHLVLEQESVQWWIVVDRANADVVMLRADHDLCVRFMAAFAERHPEATVDLPDVELSWRVAQAFGTLSERQGGSVPGRGTAIADSLRSESVLATVHPFPKMHEPLDESA